MALLRPPGTQDGSTEPEPDQQNLQPPGSGEPNRNQAEAGCEPEPGPNSAGSTPEGCCVPGAEPGGAEDGPEPRGGSRPAGRREGKPLTRMNSEESICSIQMDADSTASSGRSTPATVTGPGGTGPGGASKALSYTCCWDDCQLLFSCSPDLAEHIRATHVDGQRGGVFVCLWKGCMVYNTPSTSHSWLQRHMLSHSGDKPFKCVLGRCNATFASQGGLARHVPSHFSFQSFSKASGQGRVKEESPSKAGMKRRKMRNKCRRSLRTTTPPTAEAEDQISV